MADEMYAFLDLDGIKGSALDSDFKDQSGDTKKAYYEVKLKNIRVTSHQIAGHGGAQHPMESISLQFAEMHTTYNPQDNEGSAGGGVEFGWNLQENKKA